MAKKKFVIHPALTVKLPVVQLDKSAHSAFVGAKYHISKIEEMMHRPGMQSMISDYMNDADIEENLKREMQCDVNIFFWHLRAFFWELVATFDTMLQWANERYGLGIAEEKVRWETIRQNASRATKDPGEWGNRYASLENVWNSAWYFEVRNYRNFAHRAFLFVESAHREQETNGRVQHELVFAHLIPAQKEQPFLDMREQLLSYLEQMRQLGEAIFKH